MEQRKKIPTPKTKGIKILINIIVMLIVGVIYFYMALPAINLHARDFYVFIAVLCIAYFVSALITSGMNLDRREGVKGYFNFIKK